MDSLAILIPTALILTFVIMGTFIWAVKSDQFEDLERHGRDLFFDDDASADSEQKENAQDD